MPDYTTISDVGYTLIELIRDNMKDLISPDSIALISPGEIESKDNIRLSIFLYQITENAHMRNQEIQFIDSKKLEFPPLNLELYYMLTSYPSSGIQDKTERTYEEHSVLGRAMQILNDKALLKGSTLKGELAENEGELHITISPTNLEDITKIWNTFQEKPFRPSVCYLVTPVRLMSTKQTSVKRVISTEMGYYQKIGKREGK